MLIINQGINVLVTARARAGPVRLTRPTAAPTLERWVDADQVPPAPRVMREVSIRPASGAVIVLVGPAEDAQTHRLNKCRTVPSGGSCSPTARAAAVSRAEPEAPLLRQ